MIGWHQRKRQSNLKKHGFDFADADQVFDGVTFTYEDDRIAYDEQRVVTLGLLNGILVSIVHTEQSGHIRVISMRKATKHEREIYTQNISY
ncbi:MAG: BrnT family toxin [Burkholderiales bacterium]|nr:BrnT family toxin [Burkholderiales bacterium]